MYRIVGLLILMATPSLAGDPMSGAAFDRLTRGKTYFYGDGQTAYGAEQYLSGRRVIWSWLDGTCQLGRWYETEPGMICFVYEQEPEPQCWQFRQEGDRLSADYLNQPGQSTLYELEQNHSPLECSGPKIGV